VWVGSQKMSGWAAGSALVPHGWVTLVARGLGVLVSRLPMRWGVDGLER
jgi:hypothetical protein